MAGSQLRKNNNIIHINGKAYDSVSGEALDGSGTKVHVPSRIHQSAHDVQVIKPSPPSKVRKPRAAAQHGARHSAATSKTLMRKTVAKPALKRSGSGAHVSTASSTLPAAQPSLGAIAPNAYIGNVDGVRLRHAKRVTKNKLVSRFGTSAATFDFAASTASTPAERTNITNTAPRTTTRTTTTKAIHTDSKKRHNQASAALVERALERADSHKQPPAKHPRKGRLHRVAGLGGALVLAIAVLGFITSQNLSSARLQLASAKAGFDATLPDYKPAGYSLDKVAYSEGVVSASFNSNSDNDRNYSIIEKKSDWNSEALKENFVTKADPHFRPAQAGGRTIFIYGAGNATWVSEGVWYQVQTDGSLSDRQLINLAASI